MTLPKDEMGYQIVSSESNISSDTLLSKSKQQLPSSIPTLSGSNSSRAWIPSLFRIQVGSADDCVAPGRRHPRHSHWTSEGRLSSPETNLKVGLLPLFFMQLLLSHNMFLSFMVRTSPLNCVNWRNPISEPLRVVPVDRRWVRCAERGDRIIFHANPNWNIRPPFLFECKIGFSYRKLFVGSTGNGDSIWQYHSGWPLDLQTVFCFYYFAPFFGKKRTRKQVRPKKSGRSIMPVIHVNSELALTTTCSLHALSFQITSPGSTPYTLWCKVVPAR